MSERVLTDGLPGFILGVLTRSFDYGSNAGLHQHLDKLFKKQKKEYDRNGSSGSQYIPTTPFQARAIAEVAWTPQGM